jgi:hypothetical protein
MSATDSYAAPQRGGLIGRRVVGMQKSGMRYRAHFAGGSSDRLRARSDI